jgi:hypothetical protein
MYDLARLYCIWRLQQHSNQGDLEWNGHGGRESELASDFLFVTCVSYEAGF